MIEVNKKWLSIIAVLVLLICGTMIGYMTGSAKTQQQYMKGYVDAYGQDKFCEEKTNKTYYDGECIIDVIENVDMRIPHKMDWTCPFTNYTVIYNEDHIRESVYEFSQESVQMYLTNIAIYSLTGCYLNEIYPLSNEQYEMYRKIYTKEPDTQYCYQLATGQTVCSKEKLI